MFWSIIIGGADADLNVCSFRKNTYIGDSVYEKITL